MKDDQGLRASLKANGFPELHVDRVGHCSTKDEWGAKYKKVFAWIRERQGFMLAMIGNRGTGKTQIATCLSYSIREHKPSEVGRYARAMDVFLDIRSTFQSKDGRTEQSIIDKYVDPDLLVLDELHVRSGSDWESNILTYILDERYVHRKKTILISNDNVESFKRNIGASASDRLVETGAIVEFNWASMRGSQRDNEQAK